METLYWYIFAIPSILIASTIHEYAHALVAYKLGDPTPKALGRLSLNPLVHIDPIGALMLIIAKFGWSKPVPINEYNFKKPVLGTALVALAGPISNLLLTLLTIIVFRIFVSIPNVLSSSAGEIFIQFLTVFFTINIVLMTFNLLPIPPLDGYRIVRALLPKRLRYSWEMLEKYSIFIILLFVIPFSPLSLFTSNLITSVINFFFSLLL